MKKHRDTQKSGLPCEALFDAYFYKEGGMAVWRTRGRKPTPTAIKMLEGESGQTPAEYKRAKACEESAELSEVGWSDGSKEGMAAACKADWNRSAS